MDQLIRTQECSIVYGRFRGEDNQELFRCPRVLESIDLARYINEERALVAPMGSKIPFVDDDTENLREVEGKELIGYWRMYFRNNSWYGTWMIEEDRRVSRKDCAGVNKIIDYICDEFPGGCNWKMENYFIQNGFKPWTSGKRYLVKPFMSEIFKIMIDTTYGNGDYPVRIYVYRKKGETND